MSTQTESGSGNDILIVDDSKVNVSLLKVLLTEAGYKVRSANSGEAAFKAIQVSVPLLILLDVKMPGMDGFEVCRHLKAAEYTRSIPVIFVSGFDDEESRLRGYQAGGCDFINIPLRKDELLARVGNQFKISELQLEREKQNQQLLIEIRQREQAEKALTESNARMKFISKSAGAGLWDWDMHTNLLEWSPELFILFGLDPESDKATFENWDQCIHPNDKEMAYSKLSESIQYHTQLNSQYRVVHPDGKELWIHATGSTTYDEYGRAVRNAGICVDITERRQREEKLAEYNSRLELALQVANMAWWQMEYPSGKVKFDNRKAEMLGYSPGDFTHFTDFTKLIHPDDRKNAMIAMDRHINGELDKYETEYRIITKSGIYRWFYDVGSIVKRDAAGKQVLVSGLVIDISERKIADSILHQIIEKNPISIQMVDSEGYTIQTNAAHTRLFGAAPPPDYSIFKDEQLIRQGFIDQIERLKAGESVRFPDFSFNVHSVQPELPDNPIWLRLIMFCVRDKSGKLERYVMMHEDITERKKANEALLESEERFKALHNASFGGIAIHDKGIVLECNRGLSELTGYSYEELIGMDGLMLIAETSRNLVMDHIQSGYEKPYEAIGLRKNGDEYPLRLEGRNIPYKGKTVRTVEFRDITEQKLAVQALKESEENHRNLLHNLHAGVVVHAADSSILYANNNASQILGLSYDQLMGKKAIDPEWHFLQEDLTPLPFEQYPVQYVIDKQIPLREFVLGRALPGTNDLYWVLANAFPEFNADGSLRQVVVTFFNITELKRTQAELLISKEKALESEAKYKQIFDNTFDIMSIYEVTEDNRYKVITFNPAEAKLIGPVENYENRYIDECIPPELYEAFRQNYDRCIKADSRIEYEENISFAGIDKTFNTQLIPLKNTEGRIHRIIVISRDITENMTLNNQLKIKNEALKILNENLSLAKEKAEESEAKFREMAELLPQIVFETNLEGKLTYVNKQAYKLSGYSEDESLIGKSSLSFYIPEDTERAIENIKNSLAGKKQKTSNEYTMIRKDGTTFNVLVYSNPIVKDNNPAGLRGIIVDITEIKLAQEKIKEHSSLIRIAAEKAKLGGWIVDLKENRAYWSDGVAAIHEMPFGYSPQVDEGISFYTSEWRDLITKLFTNCAQNGIPYDEEMEIFTSTGKKVWVRTIGEALRDENGVIVKVQGALQDISEQKTAEAKIREKDIQFRKLSANVPDLIFQFTRRPDGTYCVPIASEGIVNIFGCSPEDVINDFTPIANVIYPEDASRVIADIEYSAKHLTYFTCEFRVQIPGKEIQWIYSRSNPEKLPDGSITWYGFNVNITARKQAEEERVKLFDIIENSLNEIYLFDAVSLKFQFLNQGALQNIGYTLDEMREITPFDIKPEFTEADFREKIKALITNEKKSLFFSTIHQRKNGSTYPVDVHLQLFNQDTNPVFCAIINDITIRKQAEEKISDQLKELRRWNEAMLDREERVLDLKREVNALLHASGNPVRYSSVVDSNPEPELP